MIERLLRGSAVAIALVAFIDPALTLDSRARPRVSLVVQAGPSMELPAIDGTATRRAAAERTRATLHDLLGREFTVVDGLDSASAAIVVVGDRYPANRLPEGARVSTVTLRAPISPNVAITRIDAPRAVPPATTVRLGVIVAGAGVRGSTSVLVVRAGGVEVARASHGWSADQETWRADVDAVPIGDPPYTFQASVEPLRAERTTADNQGRVSVGRADRLRVLVFEARPSWASAFVRRVLEADPRFDVSGIASVAPKAAVTSGSAPAFPVDDQLARFDAILVGGVEQLSQAQLATLDRFMRIRGGSVALVPDVRLPAALLAWIPGVALAETLLERAAPLEHSESSTLPRLDASELLEAEALPPSANVLLRASSSHRPVVWSMPRGDGRLFVSGAMDAWRYRAEPQVAFDRFWRSVVSGLALAARPGIELTLSPGDSRVNVAARVRALERQQFGDRVAISARAGDNPFRLWPDGEPGVFTGSFVASDADTRVAAALDRGQVWEIPLQTSLSNVVDADGLPLSLLSATHGGVDAAPSDLFPLVRHLRATTPPESHVAALRHPLRSGWWFLPFAACLSLEWWSRRRRGAR